MAEVHEACHVIALQAPPPISVFTVRHRVSWWIIPSNARDGLTWTSCAFGDSKGSCLTMTRNRTRKIYDPINVFYIFVGSPSRAFIDNQFSFNLWRVVARPFLILLSPFIFPSSMTSILLIIASTSSLLLLLWRKFSNNFFPIANAISSFFFSLVFQCSTNNLEYFPR